MRAHHGGRSGEEGSIGVADRSLGCGSEKTMDDADHVPSFNLTSRSYPANTGGGVIDDLSLCVVIIASLGPGSRRVSKLCSYRHEYQREYLKNVCSC